MHIEMCRVHRILCILGPRGISGYDRRQELVRRKQDRAEPAWRVPDE